MIQTEDSRLIPAGREEIYALFDDADLFGETRLENGAGIGTATAVLERKPGESLLMRHRVAPVVVGSASWLRFGRLDLERAFELEDHPEGTLVRVRSSWRYRPLLLNLFFATFGRGAIRRASAQSLDRLSDRARVAD